MVCFVQGYEKDFITWNIGTDSIVKKYNLTAKAVMAADQNLRLVNDIKAENCKVSITICVQLLFLRASVRVLPNDLVSASDTFFGNV